MTRTAILVVDTSVAVKWYIPEPQAPVAARLLDGSHDLVAPDLIVAELGNVLWKKVRRGELTPEEAREIGVAFTTSCPLRLIPSQPYITAALDLALRFERTVYDALYIALAVDQGGRYVTADERLIRSLQSSPLRETLWRLGD